MRENRGNLQKDYESASVLNQQSVSIRNKIQASHDGIKHEYDRMHEDADDFLN